MRIVLASDENTVGALGVCLKSISLYNQAHRPTVYVLSGDVSAASQQQLLAYSSKLKLDVVLLDVDTGHLREIAAGLPRAHLTFGSLMRLTMASVLPPEVDKVLYIDVDTLVLRDLGTLYELELDGATLAALREPMTHLQDLGVSSRSYFNSGVMLLNLDRWRNQNVEERVLKVLSEHADKLAYWDQCALNITLAGQTASLPRTYNYIFDPNQALRHFELPHILHYAGASKPWPNAANSPWGAMYFEMSADTPWAVKYLQPPVGFMRRVQRRTRKIAQQVQHFF